MRALAEYAMRGYPQAALAVVLTTALPFLFWIGAALVALVTLRRGWRDGILVGVWALAPALAWFLGLNDSSPLLVVVSTWILAVVLRQAGSWNAVLIGSVGLGIAGVLFIQTWQAELFQEVLAVLREVFANVQSRMEAGRAAELDRILEPLLKGSWGMVQALTVLSCLMLARWWQSQLFVPGGFRREMHALRLPAWLAALMMLMILGGPSLAPSLVGWMPVLSVPFLVAGVALVHGLVGIRELGSHWLFMFYVVFVLVGQFMAPVLMVMALLDSWMDFRGRLRSSMGPDES